MASCPYKSNLENMSSSLFAVKACGLADATYPTVICRTQLKLVMKSTSSRRRHRHLIIIIIIIVITTTTTIIIITIIIIYT